MIRLLKLGLATMTVALGLFFSIPAVLGVFDYASCRAELGQYKGVDRVGLAWACNYDLRVALLSAALALAFGITSYFLLRSRWRRTGSLTETAISN